MRWSFVFLNAEVKAELDELAEDVRASFERIVQLVQSVGLERVHEPYIKHIEDRIWEMRLRGRGSRGLCDGDRQARGGPSRIHEENPEDPATRN